MGTHPTYTHARAHSCVRFLYDKWYCYNIPKALFIYFFIYSFLKSYVSSKVVQVYDFWNINKCQSELHKADMELDTNIHKPY